MSNPFDERILEHLRVLAEEVHHVHLAITGTHSQRDEQLLNQSLHRAKVIARRLRHVSKSLKALDAATPAA